MRTERLFAMMRPLRRIQSLALRDERQFAGSDTEKGQDFLFAEILPFFLPALDSTSTLTS